LKAVAGLASATAFFLRYGLRVGAGRFLPRSAGGRSRFEQRGVSRVFVGGLEQALADIVIRHLPCQTLGSIGLKPVMPNLCHRRLNALADSGAFRSNAPGNKAGTDC
jgi:hypothetical protein